MNSGKTIIGCKWIFKKKHGIDRSTRFKSRIVLKGFMQVPGVDYTKKFSPVANDATTKVIISITLKNKHLSWVYRIADIEAAILESLKDILSYMGWPPGSVELGYATE